VAEQELRTATTETQATAKSPQNDPKPKSKAAKASRATSSEPERVRPKLNERGVPVTNWDNPEQDPNLRAHVGDSPDGKHNQDNKAAKAALKEQKS
jgi:hypothetical protein